MKKLLLAIVLLGFSAHANTHNQGDYLVKVTPELKTSMMMKLQTMTPERTQVRDLGVANWVRVKVPEGQVQAMNFQALAKQPGVVAVQPNYKIKLLDNPSLLTARAKFAAANSPALPADGKNLAAGDNPSIPASGSGGSGSDPLFSSQWGMNDIGVRDAWRVTPGNPDMIVAVIDTGVDYTHEDLVDNLWRNPREIPNNNIDDDNNGYVDDVIGWDFVSDDNKPFDLKGNIFAGGNPGHGTHCAGNVAARGDNGKGIAGVAPNVKIMILRFISDQGGGTTADAILAVRYAVDNGAMVTSNSWGSEGEDPDDSTGNQALRDVIQYSQDQGSLFVAAAGNGHNGVGYDNDSDSRPAYPASYDHDNIISVAALDANDNLGGFSNWGRRSVDLGAPGVKVFSTVVGDGYTDMVLPILNISWDGTSMAAPHVAGAAALYWSANPSATWREVKDAIITSAAPIGALRGKATSNGKLDVKALLKK